MRKLFYFDDNPQCTFFEKIWSKGIIEQELEAIEMEIAPRVLFLKYLNKEYKILDAGCGIGKWVIYLNQLGYIIYGLDNNKLAISKLKEFDHTLQLQLGDVLRLTYPDDYFDAYISMGVVEHFEKGPLAALKEAYRVLKPNGLIFLSTPTVNIIRKIVVQPMLNVILRIYYSYRSVKSNEDELKSRNQILNKEFKKNKKKKKYYHFLEYRYSAEELQSFLKQSNFDILTTVPHDFHGSKEHAIGLAIDFPILKSRGGNNFKLNTLGKLISCIFDKISPWIACASVLCVGRSLKREN